MEVVILTNGKIYAFLNNAAEFYDISHGNEEWLKRYGIIQLGFTFEIPDQPTAEQFILKFSR